MCHKWECIQRQKTPNIKSEKGVSSVTKDTDNITPGMYLTIPCM